MMIFTHQLGQYSIVYYYTDTKNLKHLVAETCELENIDKKDLIYCEYIDNKLVKYKNGNVISDEKSIDYINKNISTIYSNHKYKFKKQIEIYRNKKIAEKKELSDKNSNLFQKIEHNVVKFIDSISGKSTTVQIDENKIIYEP